MKKIKKRVSKISLASLVIATVSIFLLLYNKYKVSGLDFLEHDFLNIGNIINVTLLVIFYFGIFFQKKVKSNIEHVVLVLGIFGLIMILLPEDNPFLPSKITDSYLFGSPVKKLILAFQYILFEFLFVLQISFLFLTFFHIDHIIYIKGFFFSVNIFIVLFVFTYLYILKSPVSSEENLREGNNLAVVLGAAVWSDNEPSPLFQSRIRKAFLLLKDNKVSRILVMGGKAPGEISEAIAAKKMLNQLGVRNNEIMTEEKTSTTFEQIKFIASRNALKSYNKIIIVSDSFHLTRVKEMGNFFGLNTTQISSGHKLKWEKLLYFRIRETFALLFFWIFGI